jgi:hypothetical protein
MLLNNDTRFRNKHRKLRLENVRDDDNAGDGGDDDTCEKGTFLQRLQLST